MRYKTLCRHDPSFQDDEINACLHQHVGFVSGLFDLRDSLLHPCYDNMPTQKEFVKSAPRGEKRSFALRRAPAVLLFLLLFPAVWGSSAPARGLDEVRFQQLCRNFVDGTSVAARLELLEFSRQNPQSPLAALGYYVTGYRDLQEGRPESALDALELALVGADLVPIPDFILYHHAQALHELDRPARAIEGWQIYLRRFPRGHLARKAIAFLWEDALTAGSPEVIFDSHRDWPHLSKSAEALFYASAARESRGETRRAIDGYLRLHYRFPLSPASPKALAAIKRLQLDNPRESFEVSAGWKRARAEKLFQGKRYRQAVEALNAALDTTDSPAEKARLQLWRAISEFHSRRQRESLRTLQALPAKFALQPQALFYQAENYRRLEDDASFLRTVRQMEQRYPNSSWLERAWFSLANSRLVKRDLDEADRFYRKMADRFSSGRRVTRAHWRVAWHHYRKRDHGRALALFSEHLRRFPRSPHRPAALYWTARLREDSGDSAQARPIYQAITEIFSNHYYAHRSRERLAGKRPTKADEASLDPTLSGILDRFKRGTNARFSSATAQVPDLPARLSARVRTLGLIQMFEAAAGELLRTSPNTRGAQLQAAMLLHRGGHYRASTSHLQQLFPGFVYRPLATLPREIWRLLLPIEYGPLFAREARRHGLDPYLLVALVRQESAFDPRAVSVAEARGLMQLIPPTARRVARQLQLDRFSIEQLFLPRLNIRLGSQYLADRLAQFEGDVDRAVASYNAGPDPVNLWLSEGGYREAAEFVENIPFTETRNYVKILHRNYHLYKRLYGEEFRQ